MTKKTWLLFVTVSMIAVGCATQKTEAPAPTPAPAPAPAPEAQPAPAPAPAPMEAPKPKPVAQKVTYSSEVLFDFDKATLRSEGKSKLDDLISRMRDINLEVVISTGHADRIGTRAYNQRLSTRRADAVKAYLVANGVADNRVYAEGKGESQPVTGHKCDHMGPENGRNKKLVACLQPDRRVEIEVIGTRE